MGEEVDESKLRRLNVSSAVLGSDFWAVSIAAFFIGLFLGAFLSASNQPLSFFQFASPEEWTIFAVLVFIGCAAFFGRTSFVVAALGGIMAGHLLEQSVLKGFLAIIPLLFAAYAGTLLGQKLGHDFSGRDNVFDYSRAIVLYLGIGLITAIAIAFLAPMIPFSDVGISQIIKGLGW